jgi:hypothetical protein
MVWRQRIHAGASFVQASRRLSFGSHCVTLFLDLISGVGVGAFWRLLCHTL